MLIRKVESFLKTHNMAATKFGRLAARDPRFVLDLRMGRIPRPATEARTRQWMAEYEMKVGVITPTSLTKTPLPYAIETKGYSYAA